MSEDVADIRAVTLWIAEKNARIAALESEVHDLRAALEQINEAQIESVRLLKYAGYTVHARSLKQHADKARAALNR